ncbi:MAG: hypothetical protein EBT83_17255 [Betaproteobacteria bacterium]|nr:hypothetical protein [Betaproteobacteria bacterium]
MFIVFSGAISYAVYQIVFVAYLVSEFIHFLFYFANFKFVFASLTKQNRIWIIFLYLRNDAVCQYGFAMLFVFFLNKRRI